MGQTYTPPTPFAAWLKGELDTRGWGVRTLAKRMDPKNPEGARRALNRYIHEGSLPNEANRGAIARGFEIAEGDMPATDRSSSDDEDEEADQPVSLDDFLERRVRQILKAQSPPRDLAVVTGTGSDNHGG